MKRSESSWPLSIRHQIGTPTPSPAGAIATTLSVRSGWARAKRSTVAPPMELPTTETGPSTPRASSTPSTAATWPSSSGPATGVEAPKPGRSREITRCRRASSGSTLRQVAWVSPKPCSSTTVRRPCPALSTFSSVPAARTIRQPGAAEDSGAIAMDAAQPPVGRATPISTVWPDPLIRTVCHEPGGRQACVTWMSRAESAASSVALTEPEVASWGGFRGHVFERDAGG